MHWVNKKINASVSQLLDVTDSFPTQMQNRCLTQIPFLVNNNSKIAEETEETEQRINPQKQMTTEACLLRESVLSHWKHALQGLPACSSHQDSLGCALCCSHWLPTDVKDAQHMGWVPESQVHRTIRVLLSEDSQKGCRDWLSSGAASSKSRRCFCLHCCCV